MKNYTNTSVPNSSYGVFSPNKQAFIKQKKGRNLHLERKTDTRICLSFALPLMSFIPSYNIYFFDFSIVNTVQKS